MIFIGKISKGHYSVQNVGGVTIHFLCTLSDDGLYLYSRAAQSVGHLTRKSGVLATYFCFSFRFFKKGSCQLLAKVCA